MKHVHILLLFIMVFQLTNSFGQTILFSEDFESGELPLDWKQEFVKGSINWRYENGGYSLNPDIDYTRRPIAAHGGLYNALFQYQSQNSEATKLVTKRIEALEFAVKPELHFYHAQFDWKHGEEDYYHDYLRVYYKSSASASWTLLNTYTEATTEWVERIILLPENDLSADYYLAFEGETKWGWGACVDDIEIVETGVLQKYIEEVSVEQASLVSVSSGTENNPILKINIKVMGNSGYFPLNSLVVNSLNTNDNDIATEGVKVYFTHSNTFSTDNQVGTGVSFSSGQAVLNNLDFDLPTGYSYLWVTYDAKAIAGHRNTIDGSISAGSIVINGQNFLDETASPAGSRMILQSLHSDNFESSLDWVLTGEFEYGSPAGLGGSQGNPDPANAFSGTKIIGTDLTGLGDWDGDYEKNLSTGEYSAISDTFDFTFYNDLSLRYMRCLNIGVNDEVTVDISPDGGKSWQQAWSNTSMVLDDGWKLHEIDVTNQAARKSKVLVRFSLGVTNDYWQLSGWNIDDFGFTGKYVSRDVGVSRITAPVEGCGHTVSEEVTVVVRNYGADESYGVIPLQYSFNGNTTIVRDTLYQVIPAGDSVLFTFEEKTDLSDPDRYHVIAATVMEGDDDATNDRIDRMFYAQPTISQDHIEHFESDGGLWMAKAGNSSNWQWGAPGFGINPPSGSMLWMTQLIANYPSNDSSFVESVCFQNNDTTRKIIRLKYWIYTEGARDGASVQYSSDNGNTWNLLDPVIPDWDWYTGPVQALNSQGWSGNSGGWISLKHFLPESLTDSPLMKFRVAFASDDDSTATGFAFDDFGISEAPADIGVFGIDSYGDACQDINPGLLTVSVKNFGMNSLAQHDTIIVGFDFQNTHMATDTFTLTAPLLPGQTIEHTFDKPVDVTEAGDYNITAYTLIEDDPWFYFGNNDTLSLDFTVFPKPLTMMMDSIHTRQPDTVMLRPYYHADYDYLWQDNSTGSTYDVDAGGWYYVTVTATRGNGCSSYDSSYVELLFNDVGVDSLVHPVNHCGLGSSEFLVVRVRNYGTDSIPAGYKVAVAYELNGGPPSVDTLLLSETLLSGHSTLFSFERWPVDLSEKGMYSFRTYADFSGDTIHSNDTLVKSIEIYGHPLVSLGPDKTVQDISYTLDAGTGFVGYLWDDGSTSQIREIFGSGNYWVQVFDENQCDNFDTTYINLKIRDVRPDGFASPVSDCRFDPAEPVVLKVLNSGTDTVPAGQQITVSYSLNEGAFVQESFELTAELLPGAHIAYTFTGDISMNSEADYGFTTAAVMTGDIRTSNDTAQLVIYRYPRPVVDFGMDEIIYVEEIEVLLDAGYSPGYNYQWQDNSVEHTYTVTSSGIYHVVATDTRTSCYDRDTVMVFLVYGDVGVISASLPASGCTSNFDDVLVRISNLGTSNIGKDVPIYLACDVNGIRFSLDTLVRSGNFITGTTMDLVMSGPVKLSEAGTSIVAFYTLYAGDTKDWNDTLVVQFDALPSPEINFGDIDGLLNVELPYELNAGAGHKSYLWQDGSQEPTYLVTQEGEYSVTVTGNNDCQASKTVQVDMTTSLEEPGRINEVTIYPNPSEGLFTLSARMDIPDPLTVKILNGQGQIVYAEKYNASELVRETINVQHLPRGIYYLLIYNDVLIWQGRVIIQ